MHDSTASDSSTSDTPAAESRRAALWPGLKRAYLDRYKDPNAIAHVRGRVERITNKRGEGLYIRLRLASGWVELFAPDFLELEPPLADEMITVGGYLAPDENGLVLRVVVIKSDTEIAAEEAVERYNQHRRESHQLTELAFG